MNSSQHAIRLSRAGLHWGLIAALVLGAALIPPRLVRAATWAVDDLGNANDAAPGDGVCDTGSGVCTLRAAITEANAQASNDFIIFTTNGTIVLGGAAGEDANASGDLDIANNGALTITGNGAGTTVIDGNANDRVFQVLSGATLTLADLTITNGRVSGLNGGGILNGAVLTLSGVALLGNTAAAGGIGGGLTHNSVGNTVTIADSTISGNTASVGGGIYIAAGTVTIERSLLAGNSASAYGGGVYVGGGTTLNLNNSTARANTTPGDGGGLYNDGVAFLNNATLSENTATGNGGGMLGNTAVRPHNTVIAGNSAGADPDCSGFFNSQNFNFLENASANCVIFGTTTNDVTGVNPLGVFGGAVYPLLAGSPAIDAGDPGSCPALDQQGSPRPNDGDGDAMAVCDVGAYEAPAVPVIPTNTPTPTNTPPPGATFTPTPTPTATAIVPTSPPPSGGGPQPTPAGVQPVGSAGGGFGCGDWRVTIPAGAVPDGSGLHCGPFDPAVAPPPPAQAVLLKHVINVHIYDRNGSWITQPGKPLLFCYPYTAADLAPAANNPAKFVVQTAPIGGAWAPLTTTLTTSPRQACASASHLTLFELAVGGAAASGTTYIVRTGDTLFSLALRFGTTVSALMAANGLTSTWIYVGQVLIIPGRTTAPTPVRTATPVTGANRYIVQPGDNLFRIGLRFGVSVRALQDANDLGNSIRIYAGQTLVIPARAPAASPTPTPTVTALPAGVTTHVVQPGDTLYRLALRFGTTVGAIQTANNLSGVMIYAGQRLIIPIGATRTPTPAASPTPGATAAGSTYIVKAGDTLFSLALRFNTTVAQLQAANNLRGTTIYVGQTLRIP
jgi:LysM repeat protein